jgi:transposase
VWRHLDLAGVHLTFRYPLRRTRCARCGVQAEWVPWAAHNVRFTQAFEDAVAYLAQRADRTTVATLARITWRSVAAITARVLARHAWDDRLEGLADIGIDEISYRRGQRYLTVVVDHARRRVVWVEQGHSMATVRHFFEALGSRRIARLRTATLDLSGSYRTAIHKAAPNVVLIFDRFHVQRLAHQALDEVRRALMRACAHQPAAKWIKGTRWVLHKRPWNLTDDDAAKLAHVARHNPRLYRAYLLKEGLAEVLDSPDVRTARRRFAKWHRDALRGAFAPFRKVARTLGPLRESLFAYIASHLTNALSEGINLKIRAITHRSFGVPNPDALIARILLACGGVEVPPPHVTPRFH